VEDDPERENVSAAIDGCAAGLLGGHVRDGPDDDADVGRRTACDREVGGTRFPLDEFREPEIKNLDLPLLGEP
jgi:hypothetical protein